MSAKVEGNPRGNGEYYGDERPARLRPEQKTAERVRDARTRFYQHLTDEQRDLLWDAAALLDRMRRGKSYLQPPPG